MNDILGVSDHLKRLLHADFVDEQIPYLGSTFGELSVGCRLREVQHTTASRLLIDVLLFGVRLVESGSFYGHSTRRDQCRPPRLPRPLVVATRSLARMARPRQVSIAHLAHGARAVASNSPPRVRAPEPHSVCSPRPAAPYATSRRVTPHTSSKPE